MQTLLNGRDHILLTHTIHAKEGELKLHKLRNGAYQLGEGRGAKIVTSLEDVALFTTHGALTQEVVADIQASLDRQAPHVARQERTLADIHAAAAARPGTLDEMAKALESAGHAGVVANITKVLMDALRAQGIIPSQTNDEATAPAGPFIPASEFEPSPTDRLSAGFMSPEAEHKALLKSGLRLNPHRQVFDPERAAGTDPSQWPDERPADAKAFLPADDPAEPALVGAAAETEAPARGLVKKKGPRG